MTDKHRCQSAASRGTSEFTDYREVVYSRGVRWREVPDYDWRGKSVGDDCRYVDRWGFGRATRFRVLENLYQGGGWAPLDWFDTVVLCARDFEPEALPDGIEVIRCQIHDSIPTEHEIELVRSAAELVVQRVFVDRRRVCVTCVNGLNRSGLVVAMALRLLGHSPQRAIERVRHARGNEALSNRHFVRLIEES